MQQIPVIPAKTNIPIALKKRETAKDKIFRLLADGKPHSTAELEAFGIHRIAIQEAVTEGLIERSSRGFYRMVDPDILPVEVADLCSSYPDSVACLMTAAAIHDITDDMSGQIWLALPYGRNLKQDAESRYFRVRPVYWRREDYFDVGVETVQYQGRPVQVTSKLRTVADMLRCRKLVGYHSAEDTLAQFLSNSSDPDSDLESLREMAVLVGGASVLEDVLDVVKPRLGNGLSM